MKILFLSLAFPLPVNNGHKMRTWALLSALAAEGHEITMLVFGQPDELNGQEALAKSVCREVELVPLAVSNLTSGGNYAGRLLGLFSPRPFAVQRFRSDDMHARIEHHLASRSYDAVVCDTVYSVVNLPATSKVPLVLNNVDVEHVIFDRYVDFERNPAKRLYAWMEARKVRRWEQQTCREAVVGMACSEHDCRMLRALAPGVPMVTVPNIVDTDAYTPQSGEDGNTVVYQGGMDWFPNRDAVEFFIADILPLVRQRVPGVQFLVAGRNPSDAFLSKFAAIPDVRFTGTVPDMRPIIAQAAVCVVPLRIGSGTRLKILEAGAMGKAMVSTRGGAEGLDFEYGKDILLADEPEAFAEAVAGLLRDPARRQALGTAARRRVVEQYSFSVLRTAVHDAISNVAPATPQEALCQA